MKRVPSLPLMLGCLVTMSGCSAKPDMPDNGGHCHGVEDVYISRAEGGDSNAQYHLGLAYEHGWGVVQDYARAAIWYRKAAEQGLAVAQDNLGVLYVRGLGVPRDAAEAARWYRLAADQGNVLAQSNLGTLYVHGDGDGVPRDTAQAISWLRKAADVGNAAAQCNLGIIYAHGYGVAPDPTQAFEWYRKSAAQGYVEAITNLGFIYEYGTGVAKDPKQALALYERAVGQNYAVAQNNLATLYRYGTGGVPKDSVLSRKLYTEAALQDYSLAEYNLGVQFETCEGGPCDSEQAAHWYREAALQGYADAQNNLGVLYINGKGVAQNPGAAVMWMARAAHQHNALAASNLPANLAKLTKLSIVDGPATLRAQPNIAAPAVASLPQGSEVYALAVASGWIFVATSGAVEIGYLPRSTLGPEAATQLALPPLDAREQSGVFGQVPRWQQSFPVDSRVNENDHPSFNVDRALLTDYYQRLQAAAVAALEYPPAARARDEQGTSIIVVDVQGDGTVNDVSLERSSGYCTLDLAAIRMFEHLPKLSPGPGADATRHYILNIPILFSLTK